LYTAIARSNKRVRNGLSILELANAGHIPLARGCELPLVQPSLLAAETHGDTGLGYAKLPEPLIQPIGQHGSDFLIEKVLSSPGEITLVAIGPLTNVALAIRKEPRFAKSLKGVGHHGRRDPSRG
jgi:purine nucleosidase